MGNFVVITRPMQDARDYGQELSKAGYEVLIEPMLVLKDVDFITPNLIDFDGVLASSANAIDYYIRGAAGGSIDFNVPVYSVGKHTAGAAQKAGFKDVYSVDGTGADLLAHVLGLGDVEDKRFIHICGRHVAFPLVERLQEAGISAHAVEVYESLQAVCFSDAFVEALKAGDVGAVTFFSKRTADAFVKLVQQSGYDALLKQTKALSISDAVLECVRVLPWCALYASKTPDRAGMLTVLKERL